MYPWICNLSLHTYLLNVLVCNEYVNMKDILFKIRVLNIWPIFNYSTKLFFGLWEIFVIAISIIVLRISVINLQNLAALLSSHLNLHYILYKLCHKLSDDLIYVIIIKRELFFKSTVRNTLMRIFLIDFPLHFPSLTVCVFAGFDRKSIDRNKLPLTCIIII